MLRTCLKSAQCGSPGPFQGWLDGTLPRGPVLHLVMGRTMSTYLYTPTNAPWSLKGLVGSGMLDDATSELLADAVASGKTVLVCGPKDSGRTTVLAALAHEMRTPFILVGPDQPLQVPGKAPVVSGDVPGVVHVVDGGVVADLGRTRVLTGVRRGASGSLAALADSLDSSEAFALVARRVDLVVVCARRFVMVDAREVLRRVVESVHAVQGLDAETTFRLEELVSADVTDGTASWEARAGSSAAALERIRAATRTEVFDTVSSALALLEHPAKACVTSEDTLEALIPYGGHEALAAADLLLVARTQGRGAAELPDPFLALAQCKVLSTAVRIQVEARCSSKGDQFRTDTGEYDEHLRTRCLLTFIRSAFKADRVEQDQQGSYTLSPHAEVDAEAMALWTSGERTARVTPGREPRA